MGPTQAKTYYYDDLVVCVLRGGFTRVERTLLDGDRGRAVIEQRMAFQEVMRQRFEAVIQHATGRSVIGFMSGNQQDPDLICEVFVLSPTDLFDDHEILAVRRFDLAGNVITVGLHREVGPQRGGSRQHDLTSDRSINHRRSTCPSSWMSPTGRCPAELGAHRRVRAPARTAVWALPGYT